MAAGLAGRYSDAGVRHQQAAVPHNENRSRGHGESTIFAELNTVRSSRRDACRAAGGEVTVLGRKDGARFL